MKQPESKKKACTAQHSPALPHTVHMYEYHLNTAVPVVARALQRASNEHADLLANEACFGPLSMALATQQALLHSAASLRSNAAAPTTAAAAAAATAEVKEASSAAQGLQLLAAAARPVPCKLKDLLDSCTVTSLQLDARGQVKVREGAGGEAI